MDLQRNTSRLQCALIETTEVQWAGVRKRQRQKISRKLKCAKKLDFSSNESSIPGQSSQILYSFTVKYTELTPPVTPCDVSLPDGDEGSQADDSFVEFGDTIYSEQKEAAERIRQYQRNKELLKKRKYGSFVDDATGLTASSDSLCPVSIINKLPPLERVTVKKYVKDLHTKEKKATYHCTVFAGPK